MGNREEQRKKNSKKQEGEPRGEVVSHTGSEQPAHLLLTPSSSVALPRNTDFLPSKCTFRN